MLSGPLRSSLPTLSSQSSSSIFPQSSKPFPETLSVVPFPETHSVVLFEFPCNRRCLKVIALGHCFTVSVGNEEQALKLFDGNEEQAG